MLFPLHSFDSKAEETSGFPRWFSKVKPMVCSCNLFSLYGPPFFHPFSFAVCSYFERNGSLCFLKLSPPPIIFLITRLLIRQYSLEYLLITCHYFVTSLNIMFMHIIDFTKNHCSLWKINQLYNLHIQK